MSEQRKGWNKLVVGLAAAALVLLLLERMIGATILANVILLVLAGIVLIAAGAIGLIDLVERWSKESVAAFAVCAGLFLYIAARFYFDTVPAGYGP